MQQRILSQKEIDDLVRVLTAANADGAKRLSQDEIDDLVAALQGMQNGSIDLSSLADSGGILSQQEIDALIEKLRALQSIQTQE